MEIINSSINNSLNKLKIEWNGQSCITIVLCAKGYPSNYIRDSEIKNLSKVTNKKNNQVFHAGTYEKNKKIFSNGGRVLNITVLAKNLNYARKEALKIIKEIDWSDGFFRKDIGWKVIKSKKL